MLGDDFKKNYKNIMEKFEKKESSIIALLHLIQKENGYILEEDIDELSKLIEIPYSRIKSVLTFYTMFNQKKVGKYHIQICRNISCHMAGSKKLENYIKEKLEIKEGEITKDGLFSYTTVECLGACGNAPVVMINETYYENVDEKKLDEIINNLRTKK
jgi:NADH-quinone oxidoreductase E subunit